METKIKIAIVDDKPLMRKSLKALLESMPAFEIIGELANGRELLDFLKMNETDIVILDLEMPVMNGFEVLKIMQVRFKNPRTVVLSIHNDLACIRECLSLGARGYLSKDCIPEQLVTTLINVHKDGFYMEEATSKIILQSLANESSSISFKQKLSKRELEILKEIYNGKTEKEISSQLSISKGTVHFHKMNIYSKTGAHNLAELLKYGRENYLL